MYMIAGMRICAMEHHMTRLTCSLSSFSSQKLPWSPFVAVQHFFVAVQHFCVFKSDAVLLVVVCACCSMCVCVDVSIVALE